MKATKKLIPALAMLLLSAVVMSSASFAWFTMSRQVTAQGLNVTVTAPNNLLIKEDSALVTNYDYESIITRTNVVLYPASTVDAVDFYNIQDGEKVNLASGARYDNTKLEESVLAKATEDEGGPVEGGYYDFKYVVKTEGSQTVKVVVNGITVENAPSNTKTIKPVRIAVFETGSPENALLFNPVSGSANHTDGKAVASLDSNSYAVLDTVTYKAVSEVKNDSCVIATIAPAGTANITIRVWYEGEDTDCKVDTAANAQFKLTVNLADLAYVTP